MFNILFKAVSETLTTFGENELGGKLGFVAVLHTWDQKLKAHFHLHCLVAGGAVCSKTKRWVPCKNNYLFNQEALSLVFRGKFIDRLTRARSAWENSMLMGNTSRSKTVSINTNGWSVSCPPLSSLNTSLNTWLGTLTGWPLPTLASHL
jgi:hypothetical protein